MVAAVDVCVNRSIGNAAAQFFGCDKVVDAPAGVCQAGFPQIRPPGIGTHGVRMQCAIGVEEAGRQQFAEFAALFVSEAGVMVICFRVLEVDVFMGDVEVATENHGLLGVEALKIRAEGVFPCHAVCEALETPLAVRGVAVDLAVRGVAVDEVEVRQFERDDATFVVVFGDTDAVHDGERLDAREDGRAGIAFLFGTVPILVVARQVEDGLAFLHLRFLQGKDVSIEGAERFHEALFEAGAQAVDVPGNQLHFCASSSAVLPAAPEPLLSRLHNRVTN